MTSAPTELCLDCFRDKFLVRSPSGCTAYLAVLGVVSHLIAVI